MKISPKNYLYIFIPLVMFLMASCNQEKEHASPIKSSISLKNIEQASELRIKQQDSSIKLSREGSYWTVKEQTFQDDMANQFVLALSSMRGDKVKEQKEMDLLIEVAADQSQMKLYKKKNQYYLVRQNQTYQLSYVPNLVKFYSPIIFSEKKAFPLEADQIKKIEFRGKQGHYSLSKQTTYSSVEKAPFISGWFLHDYYSHDYSVEYKKMDEILSTLTHLKVSDPLKEIDQSKLTNWKEIIIQEEGKEYTLQLLKDENNLYYATVNKEKKLFFVPKGQIENLVNHPFSIIDKFLCLIMADALNKWTIEGKQSEQITAFHRLNRKSDKIISSFQLNNRNIDEADFRNLYQYIAVLSANEEYKGEALENNPYLKMTYDFTSDGSEHSRKLEFYPLKTNDSMFAIKENGNIDFVIKKDQLVTMLKQVNEFD
ncbi:hypothetical protein SFC57_02835 [Niallia circulans]|uniref:hypothetical protein n=1 Tax=Niallia circulans TaxID=1397 RepID=UPI00156102D3|nr:hypothetical protein [Niallia circulans]NRG34005.1 hypothetical protein [Niallia circulans]